MSYVSVLKNIPDFLSQPTGIAAIASVGIHGAIVFILPLVPVDSKPKAVASSSAVGLIELTPQEQQLLPEAPKSPQIARLPQQGGLQSQISLPNIPAAPLATQYPPLPPMPSQVTLSQLPQSSGSYATNSVPRQTSLSFSKNTSFPPVSSFPSSTKISSIPSNNYSSSSNYRSSYTTPRVQLGNAQALPVSRLPGGLQPNNLQADLAQIQPSSSTNIIATPPSPPPVANQQQNLLTPVDSAFKSGSGKIAFSPQTLPPWQNPSASSKLPELSVNSTTKTPELLPKAQSLTALNRYEDLRTSLRQKYPDVVEKGVIRKTIPVDNNGTEGLVSGGLVVDSEGKVLDLRFQQQQSLPSNLQVATRDYFKKNPLQANNKLTYYPFSLRFQNGAGATAQVKPEETPIAVNSGNTPLSGDNSTGNNQQQASSSEAVKLKTPVVLKPNNSSQQQASSSEAVKLKTPVVLKPNNSSQQQASSSEAVKLKTPVVLQPNNGSQQQASSSEAVKIKPLVVPKPNQKQEEQESAQQTPQKPQVNQQANNNQSSSVEKPNKLIRQLRQLREDK